MSKKNQKAEVIKSSNSNNSAAYTLLLIVLIALLYGRTIDYQFTLDDDLFIVNNPTVQKGMAGIQESFTKGSIEHFKGSNFQIYRPMMIGFFCFEQQLFGMNPSGFHFMNVLLYVLIGIVVFNVLKGLFPALDSLLRLLITVIFIIHPIHTEVVASVKSQDELLSTLFNLSALLFFLKAFDVAENRKRNSIISVLFFLLACFSKESSFAFLAIFPASIFLLRKVSLRDCIMKAIPFAMAGAFFLLCRYFSIHAIDQPYETSLMENVLYGAKTTSELIGTKLEIAFYYLKMMLVPYPMSWDYSFNQIPIMTMTELIPLFSLTAYLLIIGMGIRFMRKKPEISFGLVFFVVLIAPTANIFFPNGTTFADRFLFLPSFGFIAAMVFLIFTLFRKTTDILSLKTKTWVFIIGGLMLIIFSFMTINRNGDWKDNYAVFKSGAEHSPNSSRTTEGLGTIYMNMAQEASNPNDRNQYIDSAILYFEKSLKIFPESNSGSYKLAMIYSIIGKKDKSIEMYQRTIRYRPDNIQALNNLGAIYAGDKKFDSAYTCFSKAIKYDANNEMTLTNICIVAFNLGKNEEAIRFGEQCITAGFPNAKVYNILSMAYAQAGNKAMADKYRALFEMRPK